MENRITEPEIIDVLLGDADPVLEARVRQAVRHDPQAAALYAQWSRVIPPIKAAAVPLQSMNERVRDKVMRRLAEEPLAAGAQYFLGAEALDGDLACRWARPRWLTRRVAAGAAAALLMLAAGAPALWRMSHPELVAENVCGLITLVGRDGKPEKLRPGSPVPLPTRLQAAPGARAEIRLADRSRMVLAGGGVVDVEGRRRVRQIAGLATYTVARRPLSGLFTVAIPQGQVIDLGTEFKVSVREGKASMVRVTAGRVRVAPAAGPSLEAVAGQGATIDRAGAVIEPMPPSADLAEARARYATQLSRHAPAPQSAGPLALPPGVCEAWYPSGSLHLRAWLTPPPQDGGRRPAVVYAHSGAALTARDWEETAALRAAGVIVMAPMLRGENGNPGDFECGWGEIDDLRAAGAWLSTQQGVDPARIVLLGRGAGGTLAMLAAMMDSPFTAAIATQAPTDISGLNAAAGGMLPFDPAAPMERMLRSPRYFPESLRCPLYLVAGQGDGEWVQEGTALAGDATQAGKLCLLRTVPGAGETARAAVGPVELQILQSVAPRQP